MTARNARPLRDAARLWTPAATMLLASLISYIDRNTLALLAPTILSECGLTAEQYGWILSSFSVAYMAGNPLWGRWLDRAGVRRTMGAAVSLWTAASAAHALLSSFWSFAAARALLGFGEGATFPGGLRTVVQTLPEGLRSRGAALAYSGGSLGAVLTPVIITPVFAAFGWRAAFLFTGVIGLLWLLLWRRVSLREELRRPHVAANRPQARLDWRDRRLWAFIASYALGCLPLAFVLYQAPLYFGRALGKTQIEIGRVLWIPPLGWECGYFFWGWLADRLARGREDSTSVFRALTLAALAGTLPLAFGARIGSFGWLLALLFWAMFIAGGNVIVSLSYATRVVAPEHAGLLAGLGAGSWSAFVALAMPFFGRLMDQRAWDEAFFAAAAIPVAGFSLWLALARRKTQPAGWRR
ncbi:MAG: hexuronate transporter [Bryobacteraceae bacterium]|nr:MAG: hexuronate transporter [Bryobacteraceae bacterium]